MSGPRYTASEDSALLRKALSRYAGGACLEIGAGNGGSLVELSKNFGTVAGTDLIPPLMDDWKRNGTNYFLSDAAACFRPSTFDLVVFNPPYIAEEGADRATQGGKQLEVPKAFLRDALRVARRGGKVVFLLNQEAGLAEFREICAEAGFSLERILSKSLFYEELAVYEARALST